MMYVIVVAGGSGSRMNTAIPKQFLELNGKPILRHTVEVFRRAFEDVEMVLVLPANAMKIGKEIFADLQLGDKLRFIVGGTTRFHSVKNALDSLPASGWVMVHDAVRPCIDETFLRYLEKCAYEKGNAVPAVAVKDSLRRVEANGTVAVDRSLYRSIQTPQVFATKALKSAFEQAYEPLFTDEATVMEAMGHSIHLCNGLEHNLKITTPSDLELAKQILTKVITP